MPAGFGKKGVGGCIFNSQKTWGVPEFSSEFFFFVLVRSPYPDIFPLPTPPHGSGISGQILNNSRQIIMKMVNYWWEGGRRGKNSAGVIERSRCPTRPAGSGFFLLFYLLMLNHEMGYSDGRVNFPINSVGFIG